jgi:hypothetical protein
MYVKFAAAIVCIALCSLNVVAAVKRTPIRTTLEGSSRTTVEMMASPNSGVHWSSAVVFLVGFACFLSWGINEYNQLLDEENLPVNPPVAPTTDSVRRSPTDDVLVPPRVPPSANNLSNVVQFRSPSGAPLSISSESIPVSDTASSEKPELSPEEFYSYLQGEDVWSDDTNQSMS